MNDIRHQYAYLSQIRMHYVTAGEGEPLVLLHGWPQTWYAWRKVIPALAKKFRVIAPDLRGLGDTSRPQHGYDSATVANDVWELVKGKLGYRRFFLAGHDWGGPVAFSIAAQHRDAVQSLAIIDVSIPGDGEANISQGGKRWHHGFHQTRDLPERLIEGREQIYLDWFYQNYGARRDAISPDAVKEYLRVYSRPGALRSGFEYYRNIPTDIAQNEALLKRDGKLTLPVLALGGAGGWGRGVEVAESCRRVAIDVGGGIVEGAGHWIPEEQPQELVRLLLAFFADPSPPA
ncbi:MAG: alpha/beta hydrolase [Burkholderiales bacterium]